MSAIFDHVRHVGRIRRNAVIGQCMSRRDACIGRLRCANPPYVSPWRVAAVGALLFSFHGLACAQPTLGRLFNTPAERLALDANRGKVAAAANAAPVAAPAQADFRPLGVPGNMPPPAAPDNMLPPGAPGNMPPPTADAMMPPAPGMAADAPPAPPPAPEQLQLNGVVRSSSGRSTVWINNVPQSGPQNKFSNRNNKALTVTLPSGKKVLLRPGQRYDLADGRVKDINEP